MDTLNTSAGYLIDPDLQQLWEAVNDTAADVPATTLGAMFLRHVRDSPDHVAVTAAGRTMTYRELARSAGAVAGQLSTATTGGTALVRAEPGFDQIASVLGALIAGVPFRTADPNERAPAVPAALSADADIPESSAEPGSIACLLRTDPDGPLTPISHDALVNTVTDLAGRLDLGSRDRFLAIGPPGDEAALSSILLPLLTGGTLVVADTATDPDHWLDVMNREGVTVWQSSPTRAALLVGRMLRGATAPRSLRLAMLGGEPLALTLADRLRRLVGPEVRVINLGMYAPAGLWVSMHEPGQPESRRGYAPIGRPLTNKRIHVLTGAMTPCPVWVAGRVHIEGRGLPGDDLHRTSMTGRLLPDGTLDIVGDDATRITVHGHPLNLRDVESALATHAGVLTAVVVAAGDGSVGYVTVVPGEEVTGTQLLDHLRRRMSPYLLPSEVNVVETLPVTVEGRVDRARLTAAANSAPAGSADADAVAPTAAPDDLVARASALTAKILGLPDIDPVANLLDFGATSVQLVRLAVRAEAELGIRVEVDQLLKTPSVATLVSFAEVPTAAAERQPVPVDTGGIILDPVERMTFKDAQHGIRGDLAAHARIPLALGHGAEDRLARRRTHRLFAADPVPAHALGMLLGSLRRLGSVDGEPKYAYPSAGSLYPVQVYLTIVDGRVDGVPAGAHYYHRGEHDLISLALDAVVDPAAHAWLNRDAFRTSGFAVYLVADHSAILPMYGERARDYSLVEAGAMCQLLMTTAAEVGVGLCPVGEMDVTALRDPLRLGEHHEVLHILLGGIPADTDAATRAQAEMLRRLDAAGTQ